MIENDPIKDIVREVIAEQTDLDTRTQVAQIKGALIALGIIVALTVGFFMFMNSTQKNVNECMTQSILDHPNEPRDCFSMDGRLGKLSYK